MKTRRRSSELESPPGGIMMNCNPSFWRSMKQLFRKQFLVKVRHFTSIIEYFFALIIYLVIYPIWSLSRKDTNANPSPTTIYPNSIAQIAYYVMSGNQANIVLLPDHQIVKNIIGNSLNLYLSQMNYSKKIHYVNDTTKMREIIQSSDENGLGIYWENVGEEEGFLNPKIKVFKQTLYHSIDYGIISTIQNIIASGYITQYSPSTDQMNKISEISQTVSSIQMYPYPASKTEHDLSVAIALFGLFPIILATMPDFQTVLEEKDSKVSALSFLMGCSETTYWAVNFITPFILSLFPYIGFSVMMCFGFGMVGTSISLMIVVSILFICSHILFQMFLLTLIKKGTSGRSMTVLIVVLTIFFAYLHFFFTLNEDNASEYLKHVFSIMPISAYQLTVVSIYKQKFQNFPPVTWSNLSPSCPYQPSLGIIWLSIDCVLYLMLFIFCNAVLSRQYGTPPLGWRNLFNLNEWKSLFGYNSSSALKVCSEDDRFIKVENLKKIYTDGKQDVEALNDVSFEVQSGEVIVLIGPNGAGKSTIMNILSGAVSSSSGTLQIFGGEILSRFNQLQKYLGVCFQDNVIIPLLSVREHFYLFGSFRGIPIDDLEEAIQYFADTLQLTEMLDNRARDLSGGQKRKLCLSLALLGNPPLIILDEPTAGVDVQARQLIWKIISSLKNTTSIITSHALEEAEAVSSRLFIVSKGKIPFSGTSTELRNQHKCGYLLRIDRNDGTVGPVIDLINQYIPEATIAPDRKDTISIPVCSHIPQFLNDLSTKKKDLAINSYSMSVEQLEDMLIRLIQNEEAQFHR